MSDAQPFTLNCPLPNNNITNISISHGSGGSMTHQLIKTVFQKYFSHPALLAGDDFARLLPPQTTGILSISTDCHIIDPLFFPGGDIGRLAIAGTVNDVCMSGAIPHYMTAGFIIEEGFPLETLEKICQSMQQTCAEAGVAVIAGDTKVVPKGQADKIFITTTGIGILNPEQHISGSQAQPGDAVLISGTLGDHAMAVLHARGDLGMQSNIASDVAPLNGLIQAVLQAAPHTHVLRDPTRGGLATSLNEISRQSQCTIHLNEIDLPINADVQSACDMLGFDPLYLANEGKVIIICPQAEAAHALQALKNHPYGKMAKQIGTVSAELEPRVILQTPYGTNRILDMLSGEILPRIC